MRDSILLEKLEDLVADKSSCKDPFYAFKSEMINKKELIKIIINELRKYLPIENDWDSPKGH